VERCYLGRAGPSVVALRDTMTDRLVGIVQGAALFVLCVVAVALIWGHRAEKPPR